MTRATPRGVAVMHVRAAPRPTWCGATLADSAWRATRVDRYRRPVGSTVGSSARPDDAALVARLRAGDEQAFAALVDGWSGWMLRLARQHVPTPSVAEEVVQETWLAVLEGLDRFRGESSLRTWVYRILSNQAKRRGVRESRTLPFASLVSEDDGPTVDPTRFQGTGEPHPGGWRQFPEEWPEHVALTREVHEVVALALTDLPERQRVVVALRDLEGHTADEVCDLLDISSGNQRVLLHRGRAVVRAHLERYFDGALSRSGVYQ
jgi:RNA polymerase sigma-70 factor, ECF subfamily